MTAQGKQVRKRVTDKHINMFFWEAKELPFKNKASYLLGDLSTYGISRCRKMNGHWQTVWYEFDVYRKGEYGLSLVVELLIDFTIRDVENAIMRLWEQGGMLVSGDIQTYMYWSKHIKPAYGHKHAFYSAMRFLEALRRNLLLK